MLFCLTMKKSAPIYQDTKILIPGKNRVTQVTEEKKVESETALAKTM